MNNSLFLRKNKQRLFANVTMTMNVETYITKHSYCQIIKLKNGVSY